MRVVTCLMYEHTWWFVILAALMCLAGSFVTVRLFDRTLAQSGQARYHWCFLSAVTAGAAIWATHFVAMLGYDPGVPVNFEGTLTIISALIAVVGSGIGLMIATSRNRWIAAICGGGTFGLAIAAMHYVGMFAYRVDGVVRWLPEYVGMSLVFAMLFGALAVDCLRNGSMHYKRIWATGLLVLAIVSLHFTGMAAFTVTPIPGFEQGADSPVFTSMAAAIALVALLIVGTGISTHLLDTKIRTESQDQLRHIALHDTLTGLANRRHFTQLLEAECARLENGETGFTLLMVDLDRFKPVNDTLGHPVGDVVLKMVAERLLCAVRDNDLVARIGGDEFAVIAYDVVDMETAVTIAERIVEILGRPFAIDGNVAELGASVGIALAPEHGRDAESLTQNVDVALYTAKREGKSRYHLFDPKLTEQIMRRRLLEADLRRACMREDFRVVYQPVIDTQTGKFTGAEALVRWDCIERGEVQPSEFIPIAEELGIISRIGTVVLQQACKDAASWDKGLTIAVNLSPVQLLDPRLPQFVQQALESSGLDPERLELEITETALLKNDDLALRSLLQLRELGVRISLDDFGTGYSSLSYLHRFPINRIKIDRSFIQQLPDDPGSASIVRAISQLGESLDMKITAEGIETNEQLRFISEQGGSHVQGYLISRPVSASEIANLFDGKSSKAAA